MGEIAGCAVIADAVEYFRSAGASKSNSNSDRQVPAARERQVVVGRMNVGLQEYKTYHVLCLRDLRELGKTWGHFALSRDWILTREWGPGH